MELRLTLVLLCATCASVDSVKDTSQVISSIAKHSDHRIRPNDQGEPLAVSVSIYVINFHALAETEMKFGMDMFLRKRWKDPRLVYEDGPPSIHLSPEVAQKYLWIPDLFFPNARESTISKTLKPDYGVRVDQEGNVLMSMRTSVIFHCGMDLRYFPMDTQNCSLEIESYLHTTADIELVWHGEKAVSVAQTKSPPAFKLESTSFFKKTNTFAKGKFEQLVLSFRIRRLSAHYVALTYAPSLLLTALGALLFWLPLTALAERACFSAFLLLAMTVVLAASQYGTPQVGYLKAIDVWVASCFVFLAVAVAEVLVLFVLGKRARDGAAQDQFELMNDDGSKAVGRPREVSAVVPGDRLRKADLALRFLYPASLVLFNIVYWACVS